MKRALTVVSLALVALHGCVEPEQASKDRGGCGDQGGSVVDAVLLAYLSKARSVHLQADLAQSDDHPDEAIALLDKFARAPAPGGAELPPEVREVLADTLARLALLKSSRKDYEAAKADVRRGLELALERTHFRGRLYEVLGAVEQRVFQDRLEEGDTSGASAAKQRATAALEEAVNIQEEVILRALGPEAVPSIPR
jgi:tetratricopeptide (TPR) repeat protein